MKTALFRARNALINILWLNLRRMKRDVFWRVLLVLVNFMLFFSTSLPVGPPALQSVVEYIFVLTTLANMLFIYIRFQSSTGAIEILLAMGSSRLFIIIDRTVEMLLSVAIAAALFFISLFFLKSVTGYGPVILAEFGVLTVVTPLLTGLMLLPMEGRNQGRS